MATEKSANLAREEHSDFLVGLGAHAISVEQIEEDGKKTFAVTAFVEKKTKALPDELEVKTGNKTVKVPLLVQVQEKFKPE
jgi:hypothetical protein